MTFRIAWILSGALVLLGVLFAYQRARVFINGRETSEVLVANNKTYVSVSALREAGAVVSQSDGRIDIQFEPLRGRLQGDMIEGRLGEWLSNGTWRVRVSKVEPISNPFGRGPGYAATVEFRNLTPNTITLYNSGFDKMQLLDDAGHQLAHADSLFNQKFNSVVRADGFTATIKFGDPRNRLTELGQPDKILILFRPTGGKPPLKGFCIFLKEGTVPDSGAM
ncbi:MAG: hypothetical protein K6U12_11410 [Armatimonadetes bacterium]|nr:hypothetical protein [Armatimonadota bacterium]